MSHLINNELIWVSIPKCASYSIEQSLRNSKLNLELIDENDKTSHHHAPLNRCLEQWGNKETVCICIKSIESMLLFLQNVSILVELTVTGSFNIIK